MAGDSGRFGYGMALHGGRADWSGEPDATSGGEGFYSPPASGGDRTALGQLNPSLVADDNSICAANETQILCAPASGGAAIPVYSQSPGPGWIALRNGTLYFTTDSALLTRSTDRRRRRCRSSSDPRTPSCAAQPRSTPT
jgi:hypothetical protein